MCCRRYLLSHPSAPPDAANILDSDGDSPLFVTEQLSIARILLDEFNADPRLANKEGNLPQDAARENELEDLAAYLSAKSGVPLPPLVQEEDQEGEDADRQAAEAGQDGGEDDDDDDALASRRADEMMSRVEQLMQRAYERQRQQQQQQQPSSSSDAPLELTDAEEQELRRLVGEGVVRQLIEGWHRGAADAGAADAGAGGAQQQQPQQQSESESRQ